MNTKTRVTKREAQRVLAALKRQQRAAIAGGSGPQLVKDWDWGWTESRVYPWAIVWEEGPYDWADLFPYGGIEEEFGFKIEDVSDRIPEGVFSEAITSWAVAVNPI